MRHVFITIPTTLVSMLLLAPVVRGQCGNVTVYATNYIERQTGNDVFAYAESEIAGQDYLQWILTLETWHYYNT